MTKKIWVTFARHGIHCYPNAPSEVAYLQQPHRHLFRFRVTIEVFHNEREIEFHMFQAFLLNQFDSGVLQLNNQSCETLAESLLNTICNQYGVLRRSVSVEVSEDGECGAIVEGNT